MYQPEDLVTIKEHFLVILDSRNATKYNNGSYMSNVSFDFEDAIRAHRDTISFTCSVLSFSCPNSIYIINETNNILDMTINGISNHYVIPLGNYNSQTMMVTLRSIIDPLFTITFNPITNKYTFTHSTYNFTILSTSTIGDVLGFSYKTNFSSLSQTLTLPFTCNFNGLNSLNISFSNLNTSNIDSFNKSNSSIIQTVPIQAGSSQILFRKTNDFSFKIKQDTIDFITIALTDDLENSINFNNCHWNLTLYFSVIKDIERFSYLNTFQNILNYDQ